MIFIFLAFSTGISTSKAPGSDTSGSAVLVCSQITETVYNQITILTLYYVSYRLVPLLKVNDALYKSLILFDLAVKFKFIKFRILSHPF